MNGTLTATWQGKATRTYSIIGLAKPGNLDVTEGDEYTIYEDHYGNTYAVVDGVEFFVDHLEPVEGASVTYHEAGVTARIDRLTTILDRTERPIEGDLRQKMLDELEEAMGHLASLMRSSK